MATKGVKIPLLTKDNALLFFCSDLAVTMCTGPGEDWGQLEGYRAVAEVWKQLSCLYQLHERRRPILGQEYNLKD